MILFISACQDAAQDRQKQHVDTTKADTPSHNHVTTADEAQYQADGLRRFDNELPDTPVVAGEEASEPVIEEAGKQAPVRFELKPNPAWAEYGLGMIEVQAVVDQVTIEKIILNRGQCSAIDNARPMPVSLKFGRTYTGYINNCAFDKIIEVQIQTNLGNWTFTQ